MSSMVGGIFDGAGGDGDEVGGRVALVVRGEVLMVFWEGVRGGGWGSEVEVEGDMTDEWIGFEW